MIRILIIISFFCLNTFAQKSDTLSKRLWKEVQSCYTMFEDTNEDGKLDDVELIDDTKNGYLKVSGSFPTCGCSCTNTVKAYTTAKPNTYIFIKKSDWVCTSKKKVSASKNLREIFPFDFEKDGFFSKALDSNAKKATFYIDIEIPRKGTDTKVMLKLIPFGLHVKSSKNIVLSHSEENSIASNHSIYNKIKAISKKIQNEQTLEYLLNNEFEKISNTDKELIASDKEELITVLRDLKERYNLYKKVEHEWLLLGWNKNTASFYIKEKGKSPKKVSFIEFLKTAKFWVALC